MSEEQKDKKTEEVDYTLANPDTLTKYKAAADIAQKVLTEVIKKAKAGTTILSLCEEGDKLLKEETEKVFKGKKISKGIGFPTTVTPNEVITPVSPQSDDTRTIAAGDILKIQLGAHIDGFAGIVGGSVVVPKEGSDEPEITGEQADLLLATHYAHELMLRLILPPSINAEEGKEAAKPITQSKLNSMLQKVARAYGCELVESTTSYVFERNNIEGKKNIILNPAENVKGDGMVDVGEVWGVEVSLSLGSGKCKLTGDKATMYRRTATNYALKLDAARKILTEITKTFSTFPFTSRSLEGQKAFNFGLMECVKHNVVRKYESYATADKKHTAAEFGVIAVTKKGITRITNPKTIDLEKIKSDKKIEDEEILKLLEIPLAPTKKPKKKKADA